MVEHVEKEQVTEGGEVATVAKLRLRHQRIALCLIAGMTAKQAAETVGVTTVTVSNLQKNPQFKAYCTAMMAKHECHSTDVRQQIQDLVPAALARMSELLNADSDKVKFAAAKDLLDRGGYSPVQKSVTMDATQVVLNADRQQAIKNDIERLKEMGLVVPVNRADGTPSTNQDAKGAVLDIAPVTAPPRESPIRLDNPRIVDAMAGIESLAGDAKARTPDHHMVEHKLAEVYKKREPMDEVAFRRMGMIGSPD